MYMSDYVQQLDNILSSTGEALLKGAGSISHQQAMEKAEREYRLFQVRELSPVERAYLETIKELNAKAKGKQGDKSVWTILNTIFNKSISLVPNHLII